MAANRPPGGGGKPADERLALVAAYRRQIDRALSEGRFRFADHFCDRILDEDPRDLQAWLLKGHLAWRRFHDSRTAVSCYRQVLLLGGYDTADRVVAEAREALDRLLDTLS
jgi:hypothetical protein